MPQYVTYKQGTDKFRNGIRDGYYVTDITLTATGFTGAENTDWECIDKILLSTLSGPNGAPSGLTLTVISSTEIQLDWIRGSTNNVGTSIERTSDVGGLTGYVEIATVLGATVHYHDITCIASTLYYYRVREYV